jgi:hypothetical protein
MTDPGVLGEPGGAGRSPHDDVGSVAAQVDTAARMQRRDPLEGGAGEQVERCVVDERGRPLRMPVPTVQRSHHDRHLGVDAMAKDRQRVGALQLGSRRQLVGQADRASGHVGEQLVDTRVAAGDHGAARKRDPDLGQAVVAVAGHRGRARGRRHAEQRTPQPGVLRAADLPGALVDDRVGAVAHQASPTDLGGRQVLAAQRLHGIASQRRDRADDLRARRRTRRHAIGRHASPRGRCDRLGEDYGRRSSRYRPTAPAGSARAALKRRATGSRVNRGMPGPLLTGRWIQVRRRSR